MPEQYKRNPRTAFRRYDENILVITPDDRLVHRLNGTAAFIFDAIADNGKTKEQLLSAMSETFDAPLSEMQKDMENLLSELVGKKIIDRNQY